MSGEEADSICARQLSAGRDLIEQENVDVSRVDVFHEADLMFRGQSHVFRIPIESPGFDSQRVREAFDRLYREHFDIALPEMVALLISLRTTVIGRRHRIAVDAPRPENAPSAGGAASGNRPVWFHGTWHDTHIYRREALEPGVTIEGPAILEQLDSTIPIEPGCRAEVDSCGNLIIDVARIAARVDVNDDGALDAVTLAVVQNGLNQIASEMDLVHQKTSFSPVISEAFDRSNGIYDRHTGHIIAQGELGLPIFLGVMQSTTEAVIRHRDDLEPGDVVIVNDPYFGGTHLMDVKMVKPFFYENRLWAYLSNTGHWSDTGGMVPGGFCASATEVHQEGLRLPPVKLVRRGELCRDVADIIMHNIRVPEERMGDMRAQLGALSVGEQRLTALLDKYGEQTVSAVISEMRDRSENMMRASIATIPDGEYRFQSCMDSDGIDDDLLTVDVIVCVDGSEIRFDFSGSSPPCRGPLNSVWATTLGSVYCGMKHVFPGIPINSGCFAPIHVHKPRGTFLYAEYPRPVAGCAAETSQRIMEAIFGALGQAIPDRMFAGPAGTSGNFALGGYDPERRSNFVMYVFSGGGYGGWQGGDGISNGCSTIGISKTQPVEVLEQHFPVLFEQYALHERSAGAGRFRGGFGVCYRVKLLRGEATASFMMDHGRTGPFGMLGGRDGAVNDIEVCIDGRVERPAYGSKGDGFELGAGDWVLVRTPGGGGYGDPRDRPRELIHRDVTRDYFSRESAESDYGDMP
jgi:N-methylhydantoinase B